MSHLAASGINVYASKGTLEETNMLEHHRSNVMLSTEKYQIGPYLVKSFDIVHDTTEPVGFIIWHKESESILFLTDTMYSKYRFANIAHFICEANYDQEIIDSKDNPNPFLRDRIMNSHMSIQTLEEMLLKNDLSKTRTIVLTHLSETNSNERKALSRISERFGKETYVASAGMTINLNSTPF